MIVAETNLLAHIRTERGPIRFEDLVCDCAAMQHVPSFPKTTAELNGQLSALVKAGLVTWRDGVVEAVAVEERVESQGSLFG